VINELRIRLPLTERYAVDTNVGATVQSAPNEGHPQAKQALRIAQTTVDSLKVCNIYELIHAIITD